MSNISIQPIDRTLSGATTPDPSEAESDDNSQKAPALLEPHYLIV